MTFFDATRKSNSKNMCEYPICTEGGDVLERELQDEIEAADRLAETLKKRITCGE